MNRAGVRKKPKTEPTEWVEEERPTPMSAAETGDIHGGSSGGGISDEEEALVILIEHRTREVEHLRNRLSYYHSQLEQAEKRLHDSQSKLASIQQRKTDRCASVPIGSATKEVKEERRLTSPVHTMEDSSPWKPRSKPVLLIPNMNPIATQALKLSEKDTKASVSHSDDVVRSKRDESHRSSPGLEDTKSRGTRSMAKAEQVDLSPLVCSRSSPCMIQCSSSSHISSRHNRKLRSLILCPHDDKLFVTSALDGVVKLWQLQSKGSGANLLSNTDCMSPKLRRWPEDIAWHPRRNSLLAAYSADDGDNQISVLDLSKGLGRAHVTFLEEKPHVKGVVNSVTFMPWDEVCFATGGNDHAVVLWSEKDKQDAWKPRLLHKTSHTSAVMGVAGMRHKQMVMSAGADKRLIGFDLVAGVADYKLQIESKCMSVLPNPCDFHLLMVQAGTPGRQLRLYDIRVPETEINAFGWKQESSKSQSALINQAWSPEGLYISSGSADPMIHIFDIRYNAQKPCQSIQAHQKRVFKAEWQCSLSLLISISSDLNIGLHKIS